MIKEIVQFTKIVLDDPVFRNLNLAPKEGLHIVLGVEQVDGQYQIKEELLFSGVFNKKTPVEGWLEKCAAWSQAAWMVGPSKCFDAPEKAIHSASPFCFALKRENFEGGSQYKAKQLNTKPQFHQRIDRYFSKALKIIDNEGEEQLIANSFKDLLKNRTRLYELLEGIREYSNIKDADYVVFYLDLPLESYLKANQKYLKETLFNTSDYNKIDPETPDLLYGTSDWFNGYNAKKPYLLHQSATFDITHRISSEEAKALHNFSNINSRKPKLFPNPLPLFIMADEREQAFKIFKDDAISGGEQQKSYLDIMKELWSSASKELGNYYLLFISYGKIRDFDFVSRFEYELKDDAGVPWEVKDIFKYKGSYPRSIGNIKELNDILPDMFNSWKIHTWFDDLETKDFKKRSNYQLTMKYRKAFYDFIYKSQRQGITQHALEEILLTGIMDDIVNDKKEKEGQYIRNKLNLLFSLHQYFYPKIKHPYFMATKIEELCQHLNTVAEGRAHIEEDDQFAFAAGQVLARIYMQSETADRSFKFSEPFLRQTRADRFVKAIHDFFVRYSHKPYANRFTITSAEVLTYPAKKEIRDFEKLKPLILAGIFFKRNLLLNEKETIQDNDIQPAE